MSTKHLLIAIPALLLLAGCKSKEDQLIGKWKAKDATLPDMIAKSPLASQAKSQLMSITLDLQKEKKFVLGSTQSADGTWAYSDGSVSLTVQNAGGKSIDQLKSQVKGNAKAEAALAAQTKPMVCTLSSDMKTLTIPLDVMGQKFTVTMEKETGG